MKPIKGFEKYFISPEGDVYSTNYREHIPGKPPRKLSYFLDSSGYKAVKLSKNSKGYHFRIHRLVAEHYVDGWFEGAELDHKDRNKHNNHYTNLEWVTHAENLKRSYETVPPTRNFVNCQVYQNNNKIGDFHTVKDAYDFVEKEFGVSGLSFARYGYNKKFGLKLVRCNDYSARK